MRIEVPQTTGRLGIVAMQPFWVSHHVMTFDLRTILRRRRPKRAGPTPAVASECQDAGTRRRLPIRLRSRAT
jgi:hypothetical protein